MLSRGSTRVSDQTFEVFEHFAGWNGVPVEGPLPAAILTVAGRPVRARSALIEIPALSCTWRARGPDHGAPSIAVMGKFVGIPFGWQMKLQWGSAGDLAHRQ